MKAKRLVMMMAALFPFTGNAFAQLPDKEPVAIGRTRIVHALRFQKAMRGNYETRNQAV